nr:hypothetical protein [Marinicella sp. W31]MDC2878682.1 hypothetical protein [Marinicella sp. W31]
MNGKGWTNAGVAQSAITMAKAVLLDERSIYPASTTLHGEYGYDGDVALSMPCIIGREGVIARLPVSLNAWEADKLAGSAAFIKAAMRDARTGPEGLRGPSDVVAGSGVLPAVSRARAQPGARSR